MGIAAYYRGNAVISRQIAATYDRPAEFQFMDELNGLEKYPGAVAPFGPIHFISGHGGWWAECPITGYGFWYKTLREAVRRWRVEVTGYDNGMWIAEPRPASPI